VLSLPVAISIWLSRWVHRRRASFRPPLYLTDAPNEKRTRLLGFEWIELHVNG